MFVVSRKRYEDLNRSRQALLNDLSNMEKLRSETAKTLSSVQQECDSLRLVYKSARADNEALLRFAAAVKAAMDKLANELAEISGQGS